MNKKIIEIRGRGFEVFEDGTVYRIPFTSPKGIYYKRKKIAGYRHHNGYFEICFTDSQGVSSKISTHKMVAMAFLGDNNSGKQVDHIDGNPSNNAASNLRYLTCSENHKAFNKKRAHTTSKYRGVCYAHSRGRWQAAVYTDGKYRFIGRYDTEDAAALAWNEAAIKSGYLPEALNVIDQ